MTGSRFQIITFAGIGVANTFFHGLVLVFVMENLKWPVLLAHLLAFSAANIFSYVLNSRFTFHSALGLVSYGRFLIASLFSLCLTLMISGAAQWWGLHYWKGFLLVVILVPIFSFVIMKFWIFNPVKKLPDFNTD
jgi:putative flippase GtrA